jgi:hypothetical protein
MASKVSVRVVINRAALNAITLGLADGMQALGENIVRAARPPSDVGAETPSEAAEERAERRPPLAQNGGAATWVKGRKVAGFGLDGKQPGKPRGAKMGPAITMIAGFGFPGRFQEMGTIHQSPHPFLSPAAAEELQDPLPALRGPLQQRLAGVK